MRHYEVVCAVIVESDEVLCMQRPFKGAVSTAGKWEFPGGKIESGESPCEALQRELAEELDYAVTIICEIEPVDYQYPEFSLRLIPYMCEAESRQFTLKEHIDHCWLRPDELRSLDWAGADAALLERVAAKILE